MCRRVIAGLMFVRRRRSKPIMPRYEVASSHGVCSHTATLQDQRGHDRALILVLVTAGTPLGIEIESGNLATLDCTAIFPPKTSAATLRSFVEARLPKETWAWLEQLRNQCPCTHCLHCGTDSPLAPCLLSETEVLFMCERKDVCRRAAAECHDSQHASVLVPCAGDGSVPVRVCVADRGGGALIR